jgi:hypothetical protein
MKDLIKNILLEQTEMVPPESWPGESRGTSESGKSVWNKQSITKSMFMKGVKLLVRYNSKSELDELVDGNQNLYERTDELDKYLKLVGVRQNSEGLSSKMLWAAIDNYEGINVGGIISYDQLNLRPLKKFDVKCFEDVNEFKTIWYMVTTEAFAKIDAKNMVIYDDDGEYQQWDWPHIYEEHHEYEVQDRGTEEATDKGNIYVHTDEKEDEDQQITESKLKAGPEENDIISELEELLGNKTLTEKNVKDILKKYKSKPLTEQVLKEQNVSSEAEEAARFNQQPVTIIEAKFMTRVKSKFDSTVITKWAAMTHYDILEQGELTQIARAFGISESGRVNNALRLTQLINLIWDNLDVDDFSSFVGDLAPILQFIEIVQEYQEVTDAVYRATASSWGVDYESTACEIKDNFWNYDPDLEHLHDNSHDVFQGSERWVNITIDGNNVWDDGTMGETKNVDNKYNLDNLPC